MTGDLAIIKGELQVRCVEVCRALLPAGKVEGRLYVSPDPVQGDYDRRPALKVRLTGNVGGWAAFRGGAESAKHDLLGLIEYVLGSDTRGALDWARDFLGLRQMSREEREKMRMRVETRRVEENKRQEAVKTWKMRRAREMFEVGGVDVLNERAGKAQDYFEMRGVPLDDVMTLAKGNFRFHAQSEYWQGAQYQDGQDGRRVKIKAGQHYPAVHSAVRNEQGEVVGVHVTFLDEVLPAKAPVDKPKLMFGAIGGGVVEIACGMVGARIGKSFWLEDKGNYLILCEGIETGLSLAIAAPEARVWAGLSLVNMGNAPVWLKCVEAVILARDVNDGNRAAQKALAAVVEKLEAHGKPVTIIQSHVGDDFNDLMKGMVE